MFNYFNIFRKEIQRIKSEEVYYSYHTRLWRYYFTWRELTESSSMKARLPWVSFPVIDFLKKHLKHDSRVFEFGGGGSTLFFLDKCKEVATVEHNESWFDDLKKSIGTNEKWTPLFVLPEPHFNFDITQSANPDAYVSTEEAFKNMSFQKYASAIDSYPNDYFDVVLVDGRVRPSCMKHSISKIKKGGFLILDNSDRSYYLTYFEKYNLTHFDTIINHSGPTPFSSWFNRTSVWRKK
jgi:hypothetical protein